MSTRLAIVLPLFFLLSRHSDQRSPSAPRSSSVSAPFRNLLLLERLDKLMENPPSFSPPSICLLLSPSSRPSRWLRSGDTNPIQSGALKLVRSPVPSPGRRSSHTTSATPRNYASGRRHRVAGSRFYFLFPSPQYDVFDPRMTRRRSRFFRNMSASPNTHGYTSQLGHLSLWVPI